jgi:hypothetical protein
MSAFQVSEHKIRLDGLYYHARLWDEGNGHYYESVSCNDLCIHSATFPAPNLGSASRDEYCRVMAASIAEGHNRKRFR